MKPILFELMGLKVHSYLVFMILGYVAALGLLLGVTKWTPKEEGQGLSWPQVWDLFVVMVVSSVFGAKLGHVLFEAAGHEGVDNLVELLQADPWHWARLSEGGYVWYGGMIGALSVAVVYFRRRPPFDGLAVRRCFCPGDHDRGFGGPYGMLHGGLLLRRCGAGVGMVHSFSRTTGSRSSYPVVR